MWFQLPIITMNKFLINGEDAYLWDLKRTYDVTDGDLIGLNLDDKFNVITLDNLHANKNSLCDKCGRKNMNHCSFLHVCPPWPSKHRGVWDKFLSGEVFTLRTTNPNTRLRQVEDHLNKFI